MVQNILKAFTVIAESERDILIHGFHLSASPILPLLLSTHQTEAKGSRPRTTQAAKQK